MADACAAATPVFRSCGVQLPFSGDQERNSAEINHSVPEDLRKYAELRAKTKGRKFDVNITIDKQTVYAHMALLSARIPLIRYLFNGASSPHIVIPEIDFASFNYLLEYAYTGHLTLTAANVEDVMRGAALMRMESLTEACAEFILSILSADNVLPLRAFLRSISYGKLDNLMEEYIDSHFVGISHTAEFAKISLGELEALIDRDSLNVGSEMDVFNAVAHWLDVDPSRMGHALRLLKSVRVPLIPKPIIDDVIEKTEWVVANPECTKFIEEVKDCENNISKKDTLNPAIFISRKPSFESLLRNNNL